MLLIDWCGGSNFNFEHSTTIKQYLNIFQIIQTPDSLLYKNVQKLMKCAVLKFDSLRYHGYH